MSRRNHYGRWTAEEDQRLRDLWLATPRLVGREIAQALGRSAAACWSRARMIGLPQRGISPAVARATAANARKVREAALAQARHASIDMPSIDAAWLAGIIDARGYLGIPPSGTTPLLSVILDDRKLVAEIYHAAGMSGAVRRLVRKAKVRVSWGWHLSGIYQIWALLRAILPYLRARRQLADAILAWPIDGPDIEARRQAIRDQIAYLSAIRDLPAPQESQ
jgi:hypothetical protein